ncbi:hypothetical protein MVES_002156 [Malassezia vespertilionis]|uniref:RNB domain-containing protein n=1 Tax=Malassezia vespertilionis TaxID=2020962 RepID=A0A2N1JCA4_9BASI|nr:hypothetical protein MVES_002156 [Malassezia vespertilionis]
MRHYTRSEARSPESDAKRSSEPRMKTTRPQGRPVLDERAKWKEPKEKEEEIVPKLDYTIHVGASLAKHQEIKPGDFVEVRRTGRTFSGVVLPIPEEEGKRGTGSGASLCVVLISGVLEHVRSTDVMLQFPAFVPPKAAHAAAPLKRDYIAASVARVAASPEDLLDNLEAPMDATSMSETLLQSASAENNFIEQEPLDVARFQKRASICRKIRQLQRETDREIQRLYPAFRTLLLQEQANSEPNHDLGKCSDAEHGFLNRALEMLHRGSFTTLEATQLVIHYLEHLAEPKEKRKERLGGETIFAMHSLLMNHPTQFLVDSTTHRNSQMFMNRSLREQKVISRVVSWSRASMATDGFAERGVEIQEHAEAAKVLDGFCERARYVIQWYENNHTGGRQDGEIEKVTVPAQDGKSTFQWLSTDQEIIEFLKISVGNRRELQDDPTGSIAMSIIKRVGAHTHLEPILHPDMAHLDVDQKFSKAQEQRRALPDTVTSVNTAGADLQHAIVFNFLGRLGALTPWENPNALDTYLKNMKENVLVTKKRHAKARTVLTLQEWQEEKRHDFGDLPVYVIDSANAFELDDGISIEPARTDGEYWLHVHVADPTAWIPPEHPLAYEAEQKYTSIYFPEGHFSLLPNFAVYQGMSLTQQDERSFKKQHVMTFSARVAEDSGKVLDYLIRPSFVNNVLTLNYGEINDLFLHGHPPKDAHKALYKEAIQKDLHKIASVASILSKRRTRIGGAVNAGNPSSTETISPLPLPTATLESPVYFRGFPNVDLTLAKTEQLIPQGTWDKRPGGITSETMVSEMMLLAGRVAAGFGASREIALPFRLQDAPEAAQVALIDKLKDPVTGAISIAELQQNDIFMSPGYFSIKSSLFFDKPMMKKHNMAIQFSRFERMEAWVKQIERASHPQEQNVP